LVLETSITLVIEIEEVVAAHKVDQDDFIEEGRRDDH
jgi:hypothetical protein